MKNKTLLRLMYVFFLIAVFNNVVFAEDLNNSNKVQSTDGKPTLTITLRFWTSDDYVTCTHSSSAWCSWIASDNSYVDVSTMNVFVGNVTQYSDYVDCTPEGYGSGWFCFVGNYNYSENVPVSIDWSNSFVDKANLQIFPASITTDYNVVWVSDDLPIR